MTESFVNVYAADDEQWTGGAFKTRAEADKAGREGLPDCRRVALVRIVEKPASGLRRGKWEEMTFRGAIEGA